MHLIDECSNSNHSTPVPGSSLRSRISFSTSSASVASTCDKGALQTRGGRSKSSHRLLTPGHLCMARSWRRHADSTRPSRNSSARYVRQSDAHDAHRSVWSASSRMARARRLRSARCRAAASWAIGVRSIPCGVGGRAPSSKAKAAR